MLLELNVENVYRGVETLVGKQKKKTAREKSGHFSRKHVPTF